MNQIELAAFHPETDELCERMNRTVIQLLRNDSNFKTNNWSDNLAVTEIAINNFQQNSTKASPYYLNYGMQIKLPNQVNLPETSMPSVKEFVKRMSEMMRSANENLKLAQEKQKKQDRRESPSWDVGDRVLVSTENFKGYNKLKEKYIGPFKIVEKLNEVTYRVELPSKYRVHNVFHSSLLKTSNESDPEAFPNRSIINTQPPVVKSINDGEDEWEIEKLVAKRKRRNRIEYLVRWKGWSSEYDEWKTVDQLNNARRLMKEYDAKHLSSVEEVNRVENSNDCVLVAPGRVVESMQCQGRIRKGGGRRCKARTRRFKPRLLA